MNCPKCGSEGYRVTTREEGNARIEHYMCVHLDCADRKQWLEQGTQILLIGRKEYDGRVRVELWSKIAVGDPFVVMVPRESLPEITPENLGELANRHGWDRWLG
jgi:hypothetical protein